jgi:hypothetical protein
MHLTYPNSDGLTSGALSAKAEGAGAPAIEVTPEMVEVGQRCLDDLFDATLDPGLESGLQCIPGGWAEAVYRAMYRKR